VTSSLTTEAAAHRLNSWPNRSRRPKQINSQRKKRFNELQLDLNDVVQIVIPALRHRMVLTAEAEVEGHKVDSLLADLVRSVEVPRI
jgi:MoxR-like ATPase